MKTALRFTGGLLVVSALAFAPGPAEAIPLQSWDAQINNPNRFNVLRDFNNEAVLDKETGLVWERSPGDTIPPEGVNDTDRENWFLAQAICNNKNVGGRKGWRLATIQELMSLVDPNNVDTTPPIDPALPPGHPFNNVQSSLYWSATGYSQIVNPISGIPEFALDVDFSDGRVEADDKGTVLFVWCVRGGQGVDPQ